MTERKWCFVKKDSPRGAVLAPDMGMDAEALYPVAFGEKVMVIIKQWRNNDRLRAYWAMLDECIDACGLDYSSDTLSQLCKLETGYFDAVRMPDGTIREIPKSVALDKMSEDDFVRYFRATERFLAETYGYVKEEYA